MTINNVSDFTGSVSLNGGTTKIAALGLADGVNNGPFGYYTNRVTINGGTLAPQASFTTSHPFAIGANGGTIDVPAGVTMTMGNALTGDGNTLTKNGDGQLTMPGTVASTSSSSTAVPYRPARANVHAYPTTVVLNGGILRDPDNFYSYSSNRTNIQVPADATAEWYLDGRCDYYGRFREPAT